MHRYPELPAPAYARPLRRRLLAWFRRAQRDLPWRRDRDPYHIWVSEIMLQQTQVATVVPYYQRFLAAFPTVQALAEASEHDVLRIWEGLGYYRRARDLHRAARQVVQLHGGEFPREPAAAAKLPGIGRYTLGAILSQAFDQRLPIVEANSARVLSRWFACAGDPRSGPVQRWLWEAAERLLPARGSGEFNQALMELGALVCTPAQPSCLLCPMTRFCTAHAKGLQDRIPPKAKAPPTTTVRDVAVVVRKANRVLLVQRPAEASRWANMWEFPHGPALDGETDDAAARRMASELLGIKTSSPQEATTIRHGITRFQITMVCFTAKYAAGRFRSPFYARAVWTTPEELAAFALSSPQRRLAATLQAGGASKGRSRK
jgi:A/G-specific adenine glycosylase